MTALSSLPSRNNSWRATFRHRDASWILAAGQAAIQSGWQSTTTRLYSPTSRLSCSRWPALRSQQQASASRWGTLALRLILEGPTMQPRITVITLGVDDLERAVRFYRDGL